MQRYVVENVRILENILNLDLFRGRYNGVNVIIFLPEVPLRVPVQQSLEAVPQHDTVTQARTPVPP